MSKKLGKVKVFCKKHEKAIMVAVGVGAGLVLGVTAVKLYDRIKPKKLISGKFEWPNTVSHIKSDVIGNCSLEAYSDGSIVAHDILVTDMKELGDALIKFDPKIKPDSYVEYMDIKILKK